MDQLEHYLNAQEIKLVTRLLECIVDHQDEYQNLVRFTSGDGKLILMPAPRNPPVRHKPGDLHGNRSLLSKLESMGWIQLDAPTPIRSTKRGIRGGTSNAFFFTPKARDAYRLRNHVTDEQIREAAGEHIFDLYQADADNLLEISIDAIILKTRAERARVIVQLRLLRDMGIIKDIGPLNRSAEFGLMSLTPQGIQWAINGFPKDLASSPPVNVTVNLDTGDLLRALAAIDVPVEEKEEIKELVEELKREPTSEKVSRLLTIASSVQQLAGPISKFVQENWHVLGHLPN